jgi:hypothetical protein
MARHNRLLEGEIPLDCPVRLLHGRTMPMCPCHRAAPAGGAAFGRCSAKPRQHGDHRLSREGDIALLLRTGPLLPEGC